MKWFTSDLHFSHKNIISKISKWQDKEYCRYFCSTFHMNNFLINKINEYVEKDDEFYILGDVTFGSKEELKYIILTQIRCNNIYLIYGNHDERIKRDKDLQLLFRECCYYKEINVNNNILCLFHYYKKFRRI